MPVPIRIQRLLLSTACWLLAGILSCGFQEEPDRGRTPRAEYTLNDPGEWAGLEKEHAPRITAAETRVKILVPLKNIGPKHYIEKIGIMDETKRDVVPARSFERKKAFSVEAEFERPDGRGPFKVYAKCNLHDLWTAPLTDE